MHIPGAKEQEERSLPVLAGVTRSQIAVDRLSLLADDGQVLVYKEGLLINHSLIRFPEGKMGILIRPATPEDAASLATIEVESWRAAYRGLMPDTFLDGRSTVEKTESWRRSLLEHGRAGRKRFHVAAGDAGPAGFVSAGPAPGPENLGLVYLLYVLPEYWGRGVGRALMGAALEELQTQGFREAILWVLRANQRARRFYERLGWRENGQTSTENYGGVELEALCYQRAVNP